MRNHPINYIYILILLINTFKMSYQTTLKDTFEYFMYLEVVCYGSHFERGENGGLIPRKNLTLFFCILDSMKMHNQQKNKFRQRNLAEGVFFYICTYTNNDGDTRACLPRKNQTSFSEPDFSRQTNTSVPIRHR